MTRSASKLRSTLLIAAGAVVFGVEVVEAQQPDSVAPQVTLEQAVTRALARSPAMAQSDQQVDNAALTRRTAWGAFLPSLSASSGASLRSANRFDPATDRIVSGSADSYNAGLSAGYDVFTGGRRFAELDRTRADFRAAEARREEQRFNVTLQTEHLFFTALRQSELLEVARARLKQAEESLEMTRRQSRVGMATASDTLRARLEMINARHVVLKAETGTRAARFALGRQIGAARPVAPIPPPDLSPIPLALSDSAVLALAEQSAPSVRAAAAATAAAAVSYSAARTTYLPTLRMSTGYNWANDALGFNGSNASWSLGLSGSYPIFNGFQREATVDRAEQTRNVVRLQEADARLAVRQGADAALRDLYTAAAAIEIAAEAVRVAEEDLRVVRERYRVGVATVLDVVTSQIALDQARVNLVSSRYDYVTARSQLEAILGREL
ncbi:MAG: TolC family protein [Gemmatimonadetes bacterium]|nr:TolC family protein [Gemmatimonadota bacterium]